MKIRSTESNDPSFHRENLRLWRAEIIEGDPEIGPTINRFVDELLIIFSDNPPYSWRFRITTYKNPIFRVHNVKSGRDNDFLVVGTRQLVMLNKYFDVQFRHLFPRTKVFYGSGVGSGFDVYRLGARKQNEYMEAIKLIATTHPDWYIRTLSKG
jgi:hypothetical protein